MIQHLLRIVLVLALPYVTLAQNGDISGVILGKETGDPLPGANVMLYQTGDTATVYKATSADRTGNFTFGKVPYDTYIIEVTHIGYTSKRKTFSLNQTTETLELHLINRQIELGEIMVTSLHQQKQIKDVSLPFEVLQDTEIDKLAVFSPAEALRKEPGIELKDDGAWATSVNIRGLNEDRLVTLVDGNRIETATDIAAGLSMIDMSEIQRVEIIKGAASTLYGTGAMGGVVNFISKSGTFRTTPYINGSLLTGYQRVNDMFSQKIALTGGNNWGYFRVSGRMRNARDVKTPKGIIPNSQFKDHNVAVDAGLKPFQNHTLKLQYQRFAAEDVGIPGGAPFPGPAEATYTEAQRNLFSLNYEISEISDTWKKIALRMFHQNILRDVLMYPNAPAKENDNVRIEPQKITPTGNHYTNGMQLKSHWAFSEEHRLTAGVDLWQRKLETEREKYIQNTVYQTDALVNPVDTIHLVRGETPIPKSTYASGGLFFQDEFVLFDELLQISVGGRYDLIRVHNEQTFDPDYLIRNNTLIDPPPDQKITFTEQTVTNRSWSTNLGLLFHATKDLDFTMTFGRSFRSPSLEERYKYIDLGNKVRIGDPDLKPEKGYTLDAGFRVWKDKLNIRGNVFLNKFTDLIVEQSGIYEYEYSTGAEAGTTDTLPALINSNVARARSYGFDMTMSFGIITNTVLYGTISFVRGENLKNDDNLPLIPPLHGRIGVKYQFPGLLTVELSSDFYDDQNKVAEGEQPTEGYTLLDLSVYSEKFKYEHVTFQFFGGVENIFDTAYRNHLSTNRGVINYQPGRNIFMKMQIQF